MYKAYARQGTEWGIRGVRGLREKTDGQGEMVSPFQNKECGFGLPLFEDELAAVNKFRQREGRTALEATLGTRFLLPIRSTIEGGRGCNKCVPVLRGNGTKIAPTGYIFDQPPGGMSWVRGKLAGHVGGHVVLSPEEGVLVTSPGTESSYPRPSQLLNNSSREKQGGVLGVRRVRRAGNRRDGLHRGA